MSGKCERDRYIAKVSLRLAAGLLANPNASLDNIPRLAVEIAGQLFDEVKKAAARDPAVLVPLHQPLARLGIWGTLNPEGRWHKARSIGVNPAAASDEDLRMALLYLLSPRDNKKDRVYRRSITDEIARRERREAARETRP